MSPKVGLFLLSATLSEFHMKIDTAVVGLKRCQTYDTGKIKEVIESLSHGISFEPRHGKNVLLKPNLISASSKDALACTHPQFIAAVSEWFLDHGCKVSIGDSPAFGTAKGVMKAIGVSNILDKLPVRMVNFSKTFNVALECGVKAGIATEVLECDVLVNLPKVKAHSQLYVTLAVKNYFGVVVGLQKPWWHMKYGKKAGDFASVLLDLIKVLPDGVSFIDGITAMHRTGPISGDPYQLGIIAASENPIALETALLAVLGSENAKSPIWIESSKRGLPGAHSENIIYSHREPSELSVNDFLFPNNLKPVSFNPFRVLASSLRRMVSGIKD